MRFAQFPRLNLRSASHSGKSQGWRSRAGLRLLAIFVLLAAALAARAQMPMDAFHWIDFHDPKDAPTVAWVTQQMKTEKWSAIREIGVQWDAAVVVTSLRETPQSTPANDVYTVWSVGLAKHDNAQLLHGVNLRILDWTSFAGTMMPELGLLYDDCQECAATTYFTVLHYSNPDHGWRARWMRGNQAAALRTTGTVDGVTRTQIYALLPGADGRDVLATWNHFDYGKTKPAEDFLFEYSVDPGNGLEQTEALGGKHGDEMKARLCQAATPAANDAGSAGTGLTQAALTHGQDSPLCRDEPAAKGKPVRRPVTTPPANNRGQSEPPGGRPRKPEGAAKAASDKPGSGKTGAGNSSSEKQFPAPIKKP
jgi:hypothetical protein